MQQAREYAHKVRKVRASLISNLKVWSERNEPNAVGWKDCTQTSYLMLLVYGGVGQERFALGEYTVAERERFEDNEGLPESQQEQGLHGYHYCDVASNKLYGVVARAGNEHGLIQLLSTPGVAVALTGQGFGLPSGTRVPHSVTVVPTGTGLLVFDPVAPMGSNGVPTSLSNILNWHANLPTDIRYVEANEFGGNMIPVSGTAVLNPPGATNIKLLKSDGSFVNPTATQYKVFGFSQSSPLLPEPSWNVMQDGKPLWLLSHDCNVTLV